VCAAAQENALVLAPKGLAEKAGAHGEAARCLSPAAREGEVDGEHAHKFEGSLIALRSDSLQIYTGGVKAFKGGGLW
jgi:hypothetical protein